jgi:hypothetical protein
MAFDQSSLGKWGIKLAGSTPASQLGQGSPNAFASFMRMPTPEEFFEQRNKLQQLAKQSGYTPEQTKELLQSFGAGSMPTASDQLVGGILQQQAEQTSLPYMEKVAELYDKYQTKKGWKSAMFNTLTSGLDNLTRGIGMSFNPYGTPEAARYSADMIATAGDRMANAYSAVRTPMNIPAVTPPGAISYF